MVYKFIKVIIFYVILDGYSILLLLAIISEKMIEIQFCSFIILIILYSYLKNAEIEYCGDRIAGIGNYQVWILVNTGLKLLIFFHGDLHIRIP